MFASYEKDIVMYTSSLSTDLNVYIPKECQLLSTDKLRFDGETIVKATDYNVFFIDSVGVKHITQHDDKWQELECSFENILINDEEQWRVKTTNDELENVKTDAIQKITVFANQCRRKIAGEVDHLETAEWSEKRLRALRISNDEALSGDVAKIEVEALYREKGETVNELVDKIIANANRYENASIIITGMTAAAIEAINKAETDEAITSLLEALKVKAELELAKL